MFAKIALVLLSALLVVLVYRRLTKKPQTGSGLFTIPDGVDFVEISMVGGGGGGGESGSVATEQDLAMLGLSKQVEQDMYNSDGPVDGLPEDDCPYCKDENYFSNEVNTADAERPLVDVPRKAKSRKKKASKKKSTKKSAKRKK